MSTIRTLLAGLLLALLAVGPLLAADTGEKVYPTAEAAAQALVAALKDDDQAALLTVFGTGAHDLVATADPAEAKRMRRKVYDLAQQGLVLNSLREGEVVLSLGFDGWNFPIPLVAQGSGWRFDVARGREELLNRRIGSNELNAIAVCRAYVLAQKQYASKDRNGDGQTEFAQKLASTPGKHDGLFWKEDAAQGASPLGPLLAEAGADRKQGDPYRGYYFRILTRRGAKAPGGAKDFVVDGRMTGGYALVAWPAEYGSLGVTTFVVDETGQVYQKDLGKDTATAAAAITSYDPDSTWTLVQD